MSMLYKRDRLDIKAEYIRNLFAPEDSVLKQTVESISTNNIRPINLGPDEAKLVQILIKLHGSCKVVEVGTLVGYSTIWLARALVGSGMVYSFEMDDKVATIARQNISKSEVADKITVISGNAHEKLASIEDKGPFDAIFIDAEKGGYCKYLDWAEKNLRKGGLIIGDNTFLFGMVYDESLKSDKYESSRKVMREFNQRLADPEKYEGIIIPTLEGLTVAIKKF